MPKCKICGENGSGELCSFHRKAEEKLIQVYLEWKEAIPNITWTEYLKKVVENKHTGKWAKEVAVYKLKKEAQKANEEN